MTTPLNRKFAREILDIYFIENRARLLDIASFLDRIDRYEGAAEAKADFRYQAFLKALKILLESPNNRTKNIQLNFSDPTTEPLESAVGLKAFGAWEGERR
ncbi:MAG: hypothetical protein JW950_09965 [Deltaproteobacteria bacterium]|nr:hypothetical protein [Deltaproteobacteria bacterium]